MDGRVEWQGMGRIPNYPRVHHAGRGKIFSKHGAQQHVRSARSPTPPPAAQRVQTVHPPANAHRGGAAARPSRDRRASPSLPHDHAPRSAEQRRAARRPARGKPRTCRRPGAARCAAWNVPCGAAPDRGVRRVLRARASAFSALFPGPCAVWGCTGRGQTASSGARDGRIQIWQRLRCMWAAYIWLLGRGAPAWRRMIGRVAESRVDCMC